MGCNCGGGQKTVESWIYTSPSGQKTEVGSEAEANILITRNGGGSKQKK